MAKIIMSGPQNITLDGVVQADGAPGSRYGDWFRQYGGDDLEQWNALALDEAVGAEAWLLGRRSYEFFSSRWRDRSGPLADRLNSMPKYVASTTLVDPDWNNTKLLAGDAAAEVARLKQELDGDIILPGSHTLGRTLIEHDLVDELRLVVFPVMLGEGARLFSGAGPDRPMRLVDCTTVGTGLVHLRYQFLHDG